MCQTPSVEREYSRSVSSRWQPDQSENFSLKMPMRSTSIHSPSNNSNVTCKVAPLKKGFEGDTSYDVALSGDEKSETYQTPKISNRKTLRTGASKEYEATGESMSNTIDEACLGLNVSNDEQSVETRKDSKCQLYCHCNRQTRKSNSNETITSTQEIAENDLKVGSAELCRGHGRNRRRLLKFMATASASSKKNLRRLHKASMKCMHFEVTTKHPC